MKQSNPGDEEGFYEYDCPEKEGDDGNQMETINVGDGYNSFIQELEMETETEPEYNIDNKQRATYGTKTPTGMKSICHSGAPPVGPRTSLETLTQRQFPEGDSNVSQFFINEIGIY